MNVHQLVAVKGLEEVKFILKKAPPKASLCRITPQGNCLYYRIEGDEYQVYFPLNSEWWFSSIQEASEFLDIEELKQVVESVEVVNKFDSVQQAVDAIKNAPYGATDYRKLSCSTRYIKQSERFFEWWDGGNWRRPKAPLTDENNILRFTELSNLEKSIADYELVEYYKEAINE